MTTRDVPQVVGEGLTVLVVDDHPIYREGIVELLSEDPGIDRVEEASDGLSAVEVASEVQPDVVVMDLNMPGMSGVEATRRIVDTSPHVRVLVLTMSEDDDSLFAALRAGASGYLVKDAGKDQILLAVRSVATGQAVFGPSIARRVMAYFAERPNDPPVPFPELTEREREVLTLLARGASNPAIARSLFISPKTARNHVSNILAKLQVADRAQAIVRARDAGVS